MWLFSQFTSHQTERRMLFAAKRLTSNLMASASIRRPRADVPDPPSPFRRWQYVEPVREDGVADLAQFVHFVAAWGS